MKRTLIATAVLLFGSALVSAQPACSASGATAEGVGDPCTPLAERDVEFLGFNEREVNLQTGAPSCTTGLCLVNHFRGRVSCPYGQNADGSAPKDAAPCVTPDTKVPVTGRASDPRKQATVPPQCLDRTADRAVYCSCRCANNAGRTDDGASYCACPSGFECLSVVTSIGPSSDDVAGSYCVKQGTAYDPNTACSQGDCDPVLRKCG